MHTRLPARIALLVVAAAALTFSCMLDYRLDWQITEIRKELDDRTVSIDYFLYNNGARSMDNAMIHFVVSAQLLASGLTPQDAWTAGVDLAPFTGHADTISFTFAEDIVSYSFEVIGAGWDEDSGD